MPLRWNDDGRSGYYTFGTIRISAWTTTTDANSLIWCDNSTTGTFTSTYSTLNLQPIYSMADVTDESGGWVDMGYLAAEPGWRGARPQLREEYVWRRQPDEEIRRRVEEQRTAAALAESRAENLLLSLLSPEQQAAYRDGRPFEVAGSHGGRYRIRRGSIGNVEWLRPDGRGGGTLCAHPGLDASGDFLPDPDVALAQLLALTTDEAAFVAVANVHTGTCPVVRRRRRVSA